MTPRAALLDVCRGRAMCVSYFRPDDAEAVETISPDIMFRQRRFFDVEGRAAEWAGVGRKVGLVGLFQMARASNLLSGTVGSNTRHARRPKPAQRCAFSRLALWAKGIAALAYGWANITPFTSVRTLGSGLHSMDRRWKGFGQAGLPFADGRSGFRSWEQVARNSHDARHQGGLRLPISVRGWNNFSSKRVAV